MLFFAIFTFLCFIIVWLVLSTIIYSVIYGSLIFSYYFQWDDETRKQICPKGVWYAIIYDE